MGKICLIYNYAQHYRLNIFRLLSKELYVEMYFGDKMDDVKKIDYSLIPTFKNELNNIKLFGPFYWQKGALKLLFKDYKHYIILGEYFCLSTWLILVLAKFSNKKIHLWTHGWYGKESFLMKNFKKTFFSFSDSILLYGNRAKDLMIKEGISESKLHVIYNSLDYDSQMEFRSTFIDSKFYSNYFKNNNPTLIFIGRLTKIKKLNLIIESLNLLKQDEFYLNLAIIGKGEDEKELKNLVEKYCLEENVWFVGSLYKEEQIAKYISNADLCISPGNVGLTAMHSLVYGTPVITNDNFNTQMPEYESIVKGVTGDFFKENDLFDLSNKIVNWIENNTDREKIRTNCYSKIDNFYNPYYQLKIIENVIKANN
ncbi:glycosyltransferase [Empedobacter falsenii]